MNWGHLTAYSVRTLLSALREDGKDKEQMKERETEEEGKELKEEIKGKQRINWRVTSRQGIEL
jgi:hypothetical protein